MEGKRSFLLTQEAALLGRIVDLLTHEQRCEKLDIMLVNQTDHMSNAAALSDDTPATFV